MELLRLNKLQIGYSGNSLGAPVSLHLRAGDVCEVHGPIGSGRTTLIKTLIGELPALGGDAIVLDHSIVNSSLSQRVALRRQIGLILSDDYLLDEHSVYDNIALPLHLGRVGSSQIRRRVNTVLAEFGLLAKARRLVRDLGNAERRLTSVALVAAKYPPLVLADLRADDTDREIVAPALIRLAILGAAVLICRPETTASETLEILPVSTSVQHELLVS